MGSLRNPVGPLPSSIYWRRRAVLLSVVALLVLLVVWAVSYGGGGGSNNAGDTDGKNPAPSITPGPSGSGPAISEHPGGRDESGGGDGSGESEGSGETGGSDGSDGTGATESPDGATGGGGSGDRLPAGSGLPDCTAGAVKLTVRSVRNAYEPGEKPEFELIARNTSGADCKVDLGPKEAVLTITLTGSDDAFWTSSDCPEGSGSLLLRVPAEGSVTQTVVWDRHASAPQCATPAAGSAKAGTYLVEAKAPGLGKAQTSFVLEND
ncbi:hypothetical protein [Streptomyces jeddahensis]|uniref:hypothetical protein n=1 Tax=Streptomyces jeddahensis TaxID=1716141 RepID=UPI00082D3EDF|nr:hypothetical protein [Streptomyces jeddahensis]